MSDIERLLADAARSTEVGPSAETIEADVQRGRAGLARKRRTRLIASSVGATLAAGVLAGSALVWTDAVDTDPAGPADAGRDRVTGPAQPGDSPTRQSTGVSLVAWSGEQPDGFIVDKVPDGWFVQGSNEFSLTIAPDGDTTHPDNFVGKLVVTVYSKSEQKKLPDDGTPVQVGEWPGVVTHRDQAVLHYQDDNGNWVHIQAPARLGWSDRQLADFGETVAVTDAAKPGIG
ncbi:hypothetical protein [Streptomyces synnematoformans]|uniref:Uncharacterized protein n=1 Tax=Streptomyces synnematoformans TaxID=415721 RepID=A0ABP5IVE4_9ACTN